VYIYETVAVTCQAANYCLAVALLAICEVGKISYINIFLSLAFVGKTCLLANTAMVIINLHVYYLSFPVQEVHESA
jgi:hypothetical protein